MRTTLLILLIISISCNTTKNATSSNKLNGTWVPIQEEIGGKQLPKISFQTQSLVLSDSNYTFTAESVDKGVVKRNGNKMDIYGREGVNKGQHYTAIYKLENGQLSICYNLAGDSYPTVFDSKGKPTLFLCVFTKKP